jgi:hypothetical protein
MYTDEARKKLIEESMRRYSCVEEAEAYEREMEAAVLEEYQAEMEANARASEGLRYTDEVIEERRWREQ